MSDEKFMSSFMKMGQPEKESLMIAEKERRRTYQYLWKTLDFLDYRDIAKAGFYYTGINIFSCFKN